MSDKIFIPDPKTLPGRISGFTEMSVTDSGIVSDGWHTFDELYHYRMLYNAGMANALAKEWGDSITDNYVVKSWRHSDGELCFGKDDYFVVVMQLPTGQVSNHYHGEHWALFNITEVERAPEYDGHTPQEAALRLHRYLIGDF